MFKEQQTEESIARMDSKGTKTFSERHLFVPHADVIRAIKKASDESRSVGEVHVATTPNGDDMAALVRIIDKSIPLKEGNKLWMGVINSNSRKRASRYFGCVSDNGMLVVLDRFPAWMHVQGLDLRTKTESAFDLFAVRSTEYGARCARMDSRLITDEEAEWLIYKAKLKGIMGSHRMKGTRTAWKKLLKNERRKSAWTLCLAFGKALLEGSALVERPNRDALNQSWECVRSVNTTRLTSVEGPL